MYNGLPEFACVPVPHVRPIGADAASALPEQIETPGATKSGLTLLSSEGPCAEKLATEPAGLVVDAPTDNTFFAVDGAITLEAFCPSSSPAENMGKNSGLSCTKTSTERESAV